MSLLSIDELKILAEPFSSIGVSLYMPAYRVGVETQQNPIRFKNLIRQAEAELQAHGFSRSAATTFLQPALELDRHEFWQHQDEGLVIFLTEGFFRYYCLPLKFEELVVVSDRFHLKPLLPLLTGDGEFYILALSQKQVRVFQGSRYSVEELEVAGLPQSMDEALQYDETAQDGQFRISTSKGGTANPMPQAGSFHGQGSPDRDDIKQDILQYFHLIDRALHEMLRNKTAPLVLAGVEYLMPIYREANTYQHLVESGITENPEILKPEELQAQAWSIVEPYFLQTQQQAIAHYHELTGTGKTSTDLKEAISGAYYGRVEQLFVPVGLQEWGNFDPQANELSIHPDAEPGDEDLLNSAAIQTLLNGGEVYAVEPDQVPDQALLAAVFRY
ncbi:hypothetical protein [Pantanalinema sp. GBBB05]|uniref:baeRF3 domain-containing protein n=1 Tax=Pantanalinema sp. GBBB05 TaxID=2604139 RepID=UPI001D477399|nr:hypothetical protein [Pantanalinema sp. GBBB05]